MTQKDADKGLIRFINNINERWRNYLKYPYIWICMALDIY